MNFDPGDVLTRAWKITRNHKVLRAISVLPFLTMLLFLPIWLIVLFQGNVNFDALSTWMQNPVYVAIVMRLYLGIFVIRVCLQIASRASLTLGIYQAETALQPVPFLDLLNNGFRYFWRIPGTWNYVLVTLIVYFGMNILISIATFPFVIPRFFFTMRSMKAEPDMNIVARMQALMGVVILPLMALGQGFSLTCMKSAMMLTCLRLTRPALSSSLPAIVAAPA